MRRNTWEHIINVAVLLSHHKSGTLHKMFLTKMAGVFIGNLNFFFNIRRCVDAVTTLLSLVVNAYQHFQRQILFENPPIGWQTRFDLLHGIIDFEELDNTFSDDSDSSDDESDVGQQNATIQTVVSYLYIEMELCKNGTLEKWLQNNFN